MERKIDEIFDIGDKSYIVKEGHECDDCAFGKMSDCYEVQEECGECSSLRRDDGRDVIFKEVTI